ncbi:hypothetical protein [Streptomyces sp. NPDC093544]|uniref:hypothetical protein n=1 Tax=Streptomyces sp. NPDC093544 TaxID=3155200 RepID=UPI003421F5BE
MPLHNEIGRNGAARPTMKMWLAEWSVFVVASAATFVACLASLSRPVTLDAGATALLIAVSAGVGIFASNRFRAWGMRRKTK